MIGALAVRYNLSSSLRLVAVCPCMILVPGPHVLNGAMDLIAARISEHEPYSIPRAACRTRASSPGVAGNRPSEEDRPRKWHVLKGVPTMSNSNILGRLVVHGEQSDN